MVKKYRLIQKLPGLEIGAVFVRKPTRHGGCIFQYESWCYKFDQDEMEHFSDWFEPVDERWKPEGGERYWTIYGWGQVNVQTWDGVVDDYKRWNFGNCFQTEKQAQNARGCIHYTLKETCHKS